MNWPGRRREEGGSELLAHIPVIQALPVADNWIDEDEELWQRNFLFHHSIVDNAWPRHGVLETSN